MAVVLIDDVVFEWDDEKAASNLEKHGVPFEEAATIFRDELGRSKFDTPHSIGENRFLLIGGSAASRILTVVYVERGERVRLVSARTATPRERRERERRDEKGGLGR